MKTLFFKNSVPSVSVVQEYKRYYDEIILATTFCSCTLYKGSIIILKNHLLYSVV